MDGLSYATKVKEVANDRSPFKSVQYAYQAVSSIAAKAIHLLVSHGMHSPVLFVINQDSTLIVEYDTVIHDTSLATAVRLVSSLQHPFDTRGLVLVSDATAGVAFDLHKKFPCQNCLVIYSEFYNGTIDGRIYPYSITRQHRSAQINVQSYLELLPEYGEYVTPLPVSNQAYSSIH